MALVTSVKASDRIIIGGVELSVNKTAKIVVHSADIEIQIIRADGRIKHFAPPAEVAQ